MSAGASAQHGGHTVAVWPTPEGYASYIDGQRYADHRAEDAETALAMVTRLIDAEDPTIGIALARK